MVNQGRQVLFLEADTAGNNGTLGVLVRSINYCSPTTNPQSFGFAYYGANSVTTSGTGTGTGTAATTLQAFAAIGGFKMNTFSSNNGTNQTVTNSGSYAIGADCSIKLTFGSGNTGTSAQW